MSFRFFFVDDRPSHVFVGRHGGSVHGEAGFNARRRSIVRQRSGSHAQYQLHVGEGDAWNGELPITEQVENFLF